MPVVPRVAMFATLAASALSMLAHNLYELPLSPIDIENSGPMTFSTLLGGVYAFRPDARVVAGTLLGWGLLNLVMGGVVSVLPLPVLPFAPEQSAGHYAAHILYAVGQIPLVVLSHRALAARGEHSRASRPTRTSGTTAHG